MSAESCPGCGAAMQGDPIPAEYRVHKLDHDEQLVKYGRCYCFPYGEEATHFSRVMGHEISDVYDGVLYWSCPDCGVAWQRFANGGPLAAESAKYVAIHNDRTTQESSA